MHSLFCFVIPQSFVPSLFFSSNFPLTFTLNETVSWRGYSLDNQNNVTVAGNATLPGLAEGAHNIVVYANSTSGAMAASNKVFFNVNFTLPNITQIVQFPATNVQPLTKVFVNATVNVTINGTAPNTINQVTLDYTAGGGT
jgi:hypothetical protein